MTTVHYKYLNKMPIQYRNLYRILLKGFYSSPDKYIKGYITDLRGDWIYWFYKTGIKVIG